MLAFAGVFSGLSMPCFFKTVWWRKAVLVFNVYVGTKKFGLSAGRMFG